MQKLMMSLACAAAVSATFAQEEFDVVIYGSSPAALTAAIEAKDLGRSAVIVCPEKRIGGLTTGGLGQTDIGNKSAFGGLALQFYRDVAAYYKDEANWKWQKREDYLPDGQCSGTKGEDSMWTFEPSAAFRILEGWEKRHGLVIHRGKRLDRTSGKVKVEKRGGGGQRIVSFFTEDGTEYRGKMFVDATYEGDLLAAAGCSYAVGREGKEVYGETLNGVQPAQGYHKFVKGVDPYVKKGDKTSGLLPGIDPTPLEKPGTGDKRVQAYCFRMCLTDVPENRIPFAKPEGYDETNYELLLRNFEAGEGANGRPPWINSKMPNRKTDTNNCRGFSTDFIGQNWNWPEASYAEREKMLKAHLNYQKGLLWTLANNPRVPEAVRTEVAKWGTCKDEFKDGLGDGWQSQLYVREGRRLVGEYVMTEANCRRQVIAERPVANAAYGMDSHHVRRYVGRDGFVQNEGDVEVGVPGPYPIDYLALVPKRAECANLLVPVCISASHIAFGSIRMEPVFFSLGQVAGAAAALAIKDGKAVQDVDYKALYVRLAADGLPIPDPPTGLDIYICAGQSNMAGRGKIAEVGDLDSTRIWKCLLVKGKNTWMPGADPVHNDRGTETGVGPAKSFARAMADADPNALIGLVPCAVGGTCVHQWMTTDPTDCKLKTCYPRSLQRIRAAMERGTVKGVIWHQGESDCRDPARAAAYEANLREVIATFRKDLGDPNLPFVAGELGAFLEKRKGLEANHFKEINATIRKVMETTPNCAFVSAEGLTSNPDNLHFNAKSAREFGRRYAEAMQKLRK